ncbi:hypothetical protein H6802_04190 [Candidatus Nomurabacteria bacterium]|uniref:Uncharacterized protein n=1 Tax=candidate division WWE3 bacterium TaxID=2053526 RepID=A0A955DZM6_UNCKA|nr:hypothetical protein [candidate division WWE3 bacterium]MCB9824118.1 hypothetical protein [Candidatus Nomurabacteria bacterium]MCB9826911.1 hypothetical protein [Candidatus Nomurabacteria bacterium]MCB9828059.1 hypothetical protein [Candidatus Nomurabacteria bacterium]HXK52708.1 hypothetical protein [bacterium]
MDYRYKKTNKSTFDFCKAMLAVCVLIFTLSLIFQLSISNNLAVKGKEMSALMREKTSLLSEISELELESAKYSSLSYIEKQAQEQGFQRNTAYVYALSPVVQTASLTQ